MVNKITTPPTNNEVIDKVNEIIDNLGGGSDISGNKVNGAPLSNTSSHFFGVSTSAATDTEKVVSIPSITELTAGVVIIVLPTITSTVANATLKLNNFDAYPMRYQNSAITTSTDAYTWTANTPSVFVFDGEYWRFVCQGYRQVYSTMSVSEGTTGTATTGRVVRADYLKSTILGTKLTGLSTSTTGAVAATDTVLVGMGKLQAEVNGKQNSSTAVTHTASTAVGSATQPVYIASNGTATATTYTLGKSVPSDAVFTDTTYNAFTGAGSSTAGTTGLVPAPASGETGKYLKSNGTWSTITATYDSTTETLTIM